MSDPQGREALSVIHITVPRELKSRWIIERLEARSMNVFPIPDAMAPKYHGAGHALAAVTGGQIVDLVYVEDVLPDYDPDASGALAAAINDDRLAPTVRRLQVLGAVSVGMCGAWEFVAL